MHSKNAHTHRVGDSKIRSEAKSDCANSSFVFILAQNREQKNKNIKTENVENKKKEMKKEQKTENKKRLRQKFEEGKKTKNRK